jgi:hypothetical protein
LLGGGVMAWQSESQFSLCPEESNFNRVNALASFASINEFQGLGRI